MPTRLRLSCRTLLIIVLLRPNFYSAPCLATVQFSSPFALTEFSTSYKTCILAFSLPPNDPQLSSAQAYHQLKPALLRNDLSCVETDAKFCRLVLRLRVCLSVFPCRHVFRRSGNHTALDANS